MESGYKKLIVWKETKNLVLLTYKITNNFPKSEEFALKNQIRRAVISILSQIAEGWLRNTTKDKLHFLDIALGSLLEVEAQMDVSKDLNYITEKDYADFATSILESGKELNLRWDFKTENWINLIK